MDARLVPDETRVSIILKVKSTAWHGRRAEEGTREICLVSSVQFVSQQEIRTGYEQPHMA